MMTVWNVPSTFLCDYPILEIALSMVIQLFKLVVHGACANKYQLLHMDLRCKQLAYPEYSIANKSQG
jgi:hypothetical protein